MVKVFITIDTEIWCDGWIDIDNKFPASFKKYIYGSTPQGEYGLPFQLKVLDDYDIEGIFFVEPLFSLRFGKQPLSDIVGMIQTHKQEIGLHPHPEWIDEAKKPILNAIFNKIPRLSLLSFEQQKKVITIGKELLQQAGSTPISCFRAGSYAANNNTLKALAENNIFIDSSYNYASDVGVEDMAPGLTLIQPFTFGAVTVYPVSFFEDKSPNKYRPLQLTACSTKEIEFILNHAFENQLDSVVIVSHSFELLTPDKSRPNKLLVDRFIKLCHFLSENRDKFQSSHMSKLQSKTMTEQKSIPRSNIFRTFDRMLEQKIKNHR
ncbi:MAG: polysaccharide deacetylase [Methylomonas sp.]|nr:MAG: polysaccharide deacetylase [Methylomonas sp.]